MTIKVKQYNNPFSSKPIHKMIDDFGESNTDTSTWRPDLSVARAFLGSAGASNKQMLYDFPDGKDTGETVQTFIRTKGLDITEIESAEKRITQIIQDKSLSDEQSESKKKQRAQDLKDLSDAIKGSESDSSTDTSTSSTPNA